MCYSEYLSSRDENDFKPFFAEFNIIDKISYGTFEDMANRTLSVKNTYGTIDIRQLIRQVITGNYVPRRSNDCSVIDKDTILLIDEVDVFFTNEFFGNTYNAATNIFMPLIVTIQEKIWDMLKNGLSTVENTETTIKMFVRQAMNSNVDPSFVSFYNRSNQYKLFNKILTNQSLFDKELSLMIKDAKFVVDYGETLYCSSFLLNEKQQIVYREENSGIIRSDTYVSYQNVFNYLRLKKNNFNPLNGKNYGYLMISAGAVSYAKLPNQYPLILGVSGTISTLNESEKYAIKEYYAINNQSAIPSFFGHSNLKFDKTLNFTIETNKLMWLRKIFTSANSKILFKRSVLIFFDTDDEMNDFENMFESEIQILNKLTINTTDKEYYINEAGAKGTVTLVTRGMGRGTDFKSSVPVEKYGGIHVIQTFFSLDEKEEIQIRGRTARKDNQGTFEMILCREHLDRLSLRDGRDYFTLDRLRRLNADEKCRLNVERINQAESKHLETLNYIKSLI